jgi:hypothetical protein
MNYTWLVEKYLEGELHGEALEKFEQEMLSKPEIAAEVEKIRSLNRFMAEQHGRMLNTAQLIEDFEDYGNILDEHEVYRELEGLERSDISDANSDVGKFRAKLAEVQKETGYKIVGRRKILVRKLTLWVAASVLVLIIGAGSLIWFGISNRDYDKLYDRYYTRRKADVERDITGERPDLFNRALLAYNRQDYQEALRLFNTIPEDSINNRYFLFKGLTAMELGNFTLALQQFNMLDQDVNLRHESMWFACLCYLAMNDEEALRSGLKDIIESNGFYKDKAASLLRKI